MTQAITLELSQPETTAVLNAALLHSIYLRDRASNIRGFAQDWTSLEILDSVVLRIEQARHTDQIALQLDQTEMRCLAAALRDRARHLRNRALHVRMYLEYAAERELLDAVLHRIRAHA